MPNYGLVINSTYNPMSYEQYVAPFREYAQVYNQMADAYDALEVEANQWERLAKSQKDQDAYKIYQKYANDLRSAANDLAENGLSTKTRGTISQMKRRYSSEIKPMEDAYNYIQEKIKIQEQIKAKNPNIIFDNDFSKDVGINDILLNPYMSYEYVNLDDVITQASKAAQAQSARNINVTSNDLLGTAHRLIQQGYSIPDILPYIQEASALHPEINQLYNQLKQSYQKYGNKVDNSIITGMLQGYSADVSPIQVKSIAAEDDGDSSIDNLVPGDLLTQYVTAYDAAGNQKDFAIDANGYILINDVDKQNYYLKDSSGNLIKAENGAPKWDARSIALNTRNLFTKQTSGNNYMVVDERGVPYYRDITSYDTSKSYFDRNDMSVKPRQIHGNSKAITVVLQDGNPTKTSYNDSKKNYTGTTVITSQDKIPITLDAKTRQYLINNVDFNTQDVYIGKDKRRTGDNTWGKTLEIHIVPKTTATVGEQSSQEQANQ